MIILKLFYLSGDAARFYRFPLPMLGRADCVEPRDAQSRRALISFLLERSMPASPYNVHSIPRSENAALDQGANARRQSRPFRRGAGNRRRLPQRGPWKANSGDYLWRSLSTAWT